MNIAQATSMRAAGGVAAAEILIDLGARPHTNSHPFDRADEIVATDHNPPQPEPEVPPPYHPPVPSPGPAEPPTPILPDPPPHVPPPIDPDPLVPEPGPAA